jgi:hypothetical protein
MTLYAYTDESGNSGLDLFRSGEPTFYTLTAISRYDLDVEAASLVQRWSDVLFTRRLHAHRLGVAGIAQIADELADAIAQWDCHFAITVVEKLMVGRLKFFDQVFDSGLNPAIPAMHYANRGLRYGLTLPFLDADIFTNRLLRQFWHAFERKHRDSFMSVVDNLRWRIHKAEGDPRRRKLIIDALTWAYKNPDELLVRRSGLDAPNIVAFTRLLYTINHFLKDSGKSLKSFVHDEQNEFAAAFAKMYTVLTKHQMAEGHFIVPDIESVSTMECPLTICKDKSAASLQIVDVLLWSFRRFWERATAGHPACNRLVDVICERGLIAEFSTSAHYEEYGAILEKLMNQPFTPEQLERGRELRDGLEQKRQLAMAGDNND